MNCCLAAILQSFSLGHSASSLSEAPCSQERVGGWLLHLESCFFEPQAGPVGHQMWGTFWIAVVCVRFIISYCGYASAVPGIGVPILVRQMCIIQLMLHISCAGGLRPVLHASDHITGITKP